MVINKIVPSLKLSTKTDAEFLEYAQGRVLNLQTNTAKFPGLVPTPDILASQTESLNVAMRIAEANPGKSNTAAKNNARVLLHTSLSMAAQNCADIAGNNEALYFLSGFGMKNKAVPVNTLETPAGLIFKQGPMDGSVYATFKPVKHARSYEVWVGATNNPANWTKVAVKTSTRMLITDLTPMTICFGHCRAIGSREVTSDWSQIVEFKVM